MAALTAPPADAGTVGGDPDVTFRAHRGEENALTVSGQGPTARFHDRGAPVEAVGPLCRLDGADGVCETPRRVRVFTGDGDDRYRGPAPADLGGGDDVGRGESLSGRTGADVLVGTLRDDLLQGGRGSDVLRGRGANDTINAGAGRDVVFAGSGRDDVASFDGRRDVVFCGPGRDVVTADRVDVLVSCEDR